MELEDASTEELILELINHLDLTNGLEFTHPIHVKNLQQLLLDQAEDAAHEFYEWCKTWKKK